MTVPSISLVIVLYGKRAVTERGLDSLERALGDKLGVEIELVLVDNASPDDTGELLDAWETRATVVRNETNLNFAGGCNVGARAAGGEMLVFLNNDMEFTPGAIEAVAETAAEEGVGAAGARLLFPDGTIQHAGVVWVANHDGMPPMPQHVFHQEAGDLPAARAVLDLDGVTAACIAIRRDLFLELGGFDQSYVNGLEDIDLCLRVRSRGLRIVYRGDVWMTHHESVSRGINNDASAHNDAVFIDRWGSVCGSDDELAAQTFGGRLMVRNGLPLVPHEWGPGSGVSIEGHLRSVAPEAAEARALLIALEVAGANPCVRDWLPAWLVAELSDVEEALIATARSRLRSPRALRIEVPGGALYSARRRHGDVLRLAALPEDHVYLAGAAAIWAATPELAHQVIALGVDERRVAYLPPPIAPPEPGRGGAGVLALLPSHDPCACREALAALDDVEALRLLPNVMTPELAKLAAEWTPRAELLDPTTSEARYAQLAGQADAVLCLDPSDAFDRRALIAAATGTAVATIGHGPAAAVLGPHAAAIETNAELADAASALRAQTGARAALRDTVLSVCSVTAVAAQLGALLERANSADRRATSAPV
jgi:GT2 family glycosyltransferase